MALVSVCFAASAHAEDQGILTRDNSTSVFEPYAWSPRDGNFGLHIIDKVRSPHPISVDDLDGGGELEIVVGEHHPFQKPGTLFSPEGNTASEDP